MRRGSWIALAWLPRGSHGPAAHGSAVWATISSRAQFVRLLLLPVPLAAFPLALVHPTLPSASRVCLPLVPCSHLEHEVPRARNAVLAWWEKGLGKNWLHGV